MILDSTSCDAGGLGVGMGLFFAAVASLLSGVLLRSIAALVNVRICVLLYLVHGDGPAKLGCTSRVAGRQHGDRAALSSIDRY